MIRKALAVLALTTLPCETQAESCAQDKIISVSSDGATLAMVSGDEFQVIAGQEVESVLWLPQSDVLICVASVPAGSTMVGLYEIVNVDEHDKKVSARKLD
jgi:hypothetical protein